MAPEPTRVVEGDLRLVFDGEVHFVAVLNEVLGGVHHLHVEFVIE